MNATSLWLLLPILGALGAPEPHPSGGTGPGFTWETWLFRNRALMDRPDDGAGPGRPPWLETRRPDLGVETRLLEIGSGGQWARAPELLEALAAPGRPAQAAALALALLPGGGYVGHLKALLEDRASGRHLAGDPRAPVPLRLRAAAALGLGAGGDPLGLRTLRTVLLDPGLDDALQAAVVMGLALGASRRDEARFVDVLLASGSGPLAREAAAAGLGRLAATDRDADALLAAALEAGPAGGSRGAAVGLWWAGFGEPGRAARALRAAARDSGDEVTRCLALVALAARGDPAAPEVFEHALGGGTVEERRFTVLGLGLLARTRTEGAAERLARLRRSGEGEPAVLGAAARLAAAGHPSGPGNRVPVPRSLGGGHAVFLGVSDLEDLLDLVALAPH